MSPSSSLCSLHVMVVIVTLVSHSEAVWKCPFAQGGPNDPSVPTIRDTYQVKVEANIRRDGAQAATYTTMAYETFSYYGNRAAVTFRREGREYKAVYSYDTGEIFYVNDGECSVASINGSLSVENAFFGVDTKDGRKHVFSADRAIQYGLQFNQTYIGRDVVRGIDVDHWQSCGYWAEQKTNFTLDWYYEAPHWISSSDPELSVLPVRATVTGESQQDDDFHTFNHTYEFIDFRGYYEDETVFETPKGVYCPGRKLTKPVPKLKEAYSYNEEIVAALQEAVLNAKVWYDSTMNYVRFDYRSAVAEAPYYSTDPMTAIHDYNLGISYVRDNLFLNCSIGAFLNDTFDETKQNVTGAFDYGYVMRMRTPDELLNLDDSYQYEGTRYVRDVNTDVYVTKKPYQPHGYSEPFDATFEAYFLAKEWLDVSSGIAFEKQVPVRLVIWSPKPAFKMIYNIFNFDNDNPDFRAFDISDCYKEESKKKFLLTFKSSSNFGNGIKKRMFAALVQRQIKDLVGVNNLRVQFPKITIGGDQVYASSTLLDKPPPLALFRRQGDGSRRSKDKTYSSVASLSDCAERCRDEGEFSCNSFDFCETTQKCYVDKMHGGDPVGPKDDYAGCIHYARTIDYRGQPEPSLATAWMFLRNSVYSGYVTVDLPTDDGGIWPFRATTIRETSFKTIEDTAPGTYMTEFRLFKQQIVPMKNDKIIPNLSVDECARACSTEVDFDCKSFDYCHDMGDCMLTHVHPSDDPSVVTSHNNCDLYARLYVLQFKLYPGTSLLTQQDYNVAGARSGEDCAKACLQHTDFECRSFDYCRSTNTCLLGREHVLDVPARNVKTKPSCNHYSRKFNGDFKIASKNVSLPSVNKMVVTGSYPENCAKLCVMDMGDGCNGFGFCVDDHACILDSQKIRNLKLGQTDLKVEYKMCDLYNRTVYHVKVPQDNTRTKIVTVRPQPVTSYVKAGQMYTKSDMIGVGFGVCIGGLILGLLVAFAFYRLKTVSKPEIFQMDNVNYQPHSES